MHIIAVATDRSDEEVIAKYKNGERLSIVNFTDNQLNTIEVDLNKNHSSEKAQHAMKILRGFTKRASPKEAELNLVNYYKTPRQMRTF